MINRNYIRPAVPRVDGRRASDTEIRSRYEQMRYWAGAMVLAALVGGALIAIAAMKFTEPDIQPCTYATDVFL